MAVLVPTLTTAAVPPVGPAEGDIWQNTLNGRRYVWVPGVTSGGAWVHAPSDPSSPPSPGAMDAPDITNPTPHITMSNQPPLGPLAGDFWFDTVRGFLFVFYNDGNTTQWVVANPGRGGQEGPPGLPGAPTGPAGGDLSGNYPDPQIMDDVVLRGDPQAPTPNIGDNTTSIATTSFVKSVLAATPFPPSGAAGGDLAGTYPFPTIKADVVLTGDPKAPTPATADNDTSIATTAFVRSAITTFSPPPDLSGYAPLASPTFTGDPKAPTPATADNDTSIATTAYVKANIAALPAAPTTLPPSGPAGGALTGTYPNPTLVGGPLSNYALTSSIPTTLPPSGTAGGDLSGTYPNPTIKPSVTNGQVLTTVAGIAAWAAASGGGAATAVGITPPASPTDGQLWFYSDAVNGGGNLYIRYNDGNSTAWVPATTAAVPQGVPPGAVMDFAGATIPAGWLAANGALVSRTTYANLFAALGTLYGAGDGSTTFQLPDYGGRVLAGKEATPTRLTTAGSGIDGSVLGAAGGAQNVTLTLGHMPTGLASFQPAGTSFYQFNNVAAVYAGYQTTNLQPTVVAQPTIIANKIIKT